MLNTGRLFATILPLLMLPLLGSCGGSGSTAATTYTIGGTLSGLSGTVVLQNNGADDLSLTSDGTFTFSTKLSDAATYAVTVSTQPSGLTCSVSNGTGTVSSANVTGVSVVCSADTYTVGGTISGLSGTVVLQNNSANDLTLTATGSFTFSTAVADGAGYAVTVKTQPSAQTCSVSAGSGTISGANVTNVTIVCATNTYTVGGTLSSLSGTVVLQNNSGNDLTLTANGAFTFTTAVADEAAYAVTVKTQPSGASCSVASGTGTISAANVTNVTVTCTADTYTVGGSISGLSGTVVLQNNSGDNLSRSTNGSFTFATAVADGAAYAVTVSTQPSGYTCTVSNGSGTISGANVTNVSVTCADTACTGNCIIFVTSSTPNGDFGGIAAADALCMADANYPAGSGVFKALLVDSVNRIACTTASCGIGGASEHVDWVLAASTAYVRLDGTTAIGTTTSLGLLPTTLTNSFNGAATFSWTGLDGNPLWVTDSNICSTWTSSSGIATGAVGQNNQTAVSSAIGVGGGFCDIGKPLVCVEQ